MATTTTTSTVTSQRYRITLVGSSLPVAQPGISVVCAGPSQASTSTASVGSGAEVAPCSSSQGSTTAASSSSAAEVADVQAVAASVSRLTLRNADDPWASFSDAELNTRSGRLHGQWSFNDRLSGERPNGRWSNWYQGTGVSGWLHNCGEIYSWCLK